MKKLLLTGVGPLVAMAAFAQGVVDFSNASSRFWPDAIDRRAYFWNWSIPLTPVASNSFGLNLASLRATLYYAASTVTDPTLFQRAVVPEGTTFRSSSSANVGSWIGKYSTLTSIPNGTTANLFVVVWDSNLSRDPLSWQARNGTWGSSAIFSYTPPTSPTPSPAEFLMVNLRSFNVWIVPEPSALALIALGAASLLILYRRR